jgi:hypothetical protein
VHYQRPALRVLEQRCGDRTSATCGLLRHDLEHASAKLLRTVGREKPLPAVDRYDSRQIVFHTSDDLVVFAHLVRHVVFPLEMTGLPALRSPCEQSG